MSGHSKWSQIKHKKGVTDQKRGQLFSKLSKNITLAARNGTDPKMNVPLANAIAQAHYFESPDIKHRIYRYELIQTHELAHLLGASHTDAMDYDKMNTHIQSLLLHRNEVPVKFASRSIAEMRLCLANKLKIQLLPRRFCERKKGRANKIKCYMRRGLGKSA